MADEHDIALRSARDRIIDLAGIGDPYPITDLNVLADRLKVTFGGSAKIGIENAQAGVTYVLCDPKGKPVVQTLDSKGKPLDKPKSFKGDGKDETLVLETPPVNADVTYRIRAAKDWQTARFLDEQAPVKVGIDGTLDLEIQAPVLDTKRPTKQSSDPRIVAFGEIAVVRVGSAADNEPKTQEGVIYTLVINDIDIPASADKGNLGTVDLTTPAMREDSTIQVRATKKFALTEERADEVILLDAKRYLKVKPNPALGVSVGADPIVDYDKAASIVVKDSEPKVKYRAYVRLIPDADFLRRATSAITVGVAVPGKEEPVKVRTPEPPDPLSVPGGYEALGDAPVAGNGKELGLATKPLKDDAIFLVQAVKEHRADPEDTIVRSTVWLAQPAVALVRPDPAKLLTLRVPVAGTQTGGSMQVSGGQPGVYYYFRPAASSKELERPAYFHKRDELDKVNKGVGLLEIGVDFSIAAGSPGVAADRAAAAPQPPLLEIPALAPGDSLAVRAVKAQTGVETPMTLQAQIPKLLSVSADPAIVDYGASAKIAASGSAEGWEFTLNRAPVTLPGETGPLIADATLEVVATQPAAKGMKVEVVLPGMRVLVKPNAALAVAASMEAVKKDNATTIVVRGSQAGVNYRLMAGNIAVGEAAAGTGADLALPTGKISADTTFSVTATRADNPLLTAVLEQRVTVKLDLT